MNLIIAEILHRKHLQWKNYFDLFTRLFYVKMKVLLAPCHNIGPTQ